LYLSVVKIFLIYDNETKIIWCDFETNYTAINTVGLTFTLSTRNAAITVINRTCPGTIDFKLIDHDGFYYVNTTWILYNICEVDAFLNFTVGYYSTNNITTTIVIGMALGLIFCIIIILCVVWIVSKGTYNHYTPN